MLPMVVVAVGGNGADLSDHVAGDRLRKFLDVFDDCIDGLLDTALQSHRVCPSGHMLDAFAEDGLRQNGGRRGAVASDVRGLRRHFTHHLRAHVLERILQLDLLGHRHAVLGDGRASEFLLQNYVAALGAERHLDGIRQLVDAT